jgi:CelD/BcsL family acetyltransferase involved in cellulose biosynthesis
VAGGLARFAREWDAIVVDRFPPGSNSTGIAAANGLRVHPRPPLLAPWLELPESFDAYLASLSSNRRSKVRRYLRPLDSGEVAIREVTEPAELRVALERWQALRVAWWESRDRPLDPEHASPRFLAFTTDAALRMVPVGRAVVWDFRSEGETIGVAVNFLTDDTFFYWLNGFDPAHAGLRLGHGVVAHGIRSAIEAGRTGFDFMIGTEGYKYDYGAVDRELGSAVVTNGRPRSRAAAAGTGVLHRIRRRNSPEMGPKAG